MNNAQRLLPPHSIESEQSVLGGLMLDNDRWDDIATIVSADNFYVRPHQLIFNAMHDLLMQGKPVDLITLSEHLEQRGVLEQVGGFALMNPLMILVKIIKLRWIHILSYDQMVSRKINNQ
uniref:DnaB-like helicase N-terminal domain-containing protein n=1 Tax=Klebsiella pneumoniae TaxID=573 RepID=UPI002934C83A